MKATISTFSCKQHCLPVATVNVIFEQGDWERIMKKRAKNKKIINAAIKGLVTELITR